MRKKDKTAAIFIPEEDGNCGGFAFYGDFTNQKPPSFPLAVSRSHGPEETLSFCRPHYIRKPFRCRRIETASGISCSVKGWPEQELCQCALHINGSYAYRSRGHRRCDRLRRAHGHGGHSEHWDRSPDFR